jgi:hypothetical protein
MMSNKKNRLLDRANGSDVRHPQSKVMWVLGTLLSILVAIGAYSKGSVFVRYLISPKIFSVVRTTSLGGSANTGIFNSYHTKYGELLTPVQIMLYLNIRNESDEPQTIEGILLEFQGQDSRWTPVTVLSPHHGSGVYTDFGGSTQLKKAKLLDLQGMSLELTLGSGSLAPHQVVSGWLFLEFPEQFRKSNMLNNPLRITICSGFGEREIHNIKHVDLPPNATQTRKAFLKFTGGERDISQLPIMAESDLMKKLAEEREKH